MRAETVGDEDLHVTRGPGRPFSGPSGAPPLYRLAAMMTAGSCTPRIESNRSSCSRVRERTSVSAPFTWEFADDQAGWTRHGT